MSKNSQKNPSGELAGLPTFFPWPQGTKLWRSCSSGYILPAGGSLFNWIYWFWLLIAARMENLKAPLALCCVRDSYKQYTGFVRPKRLTSGCVYWLWIKEAVWCSSKNISLFVLMIRLFQEVVIEEEVWISSSSSGSSSRGWVVVVRWHGDTKTTPVTAAIVQWNLCITTTLGINQQLSV